VRKDKRRDGKVPRRVLRERWRREIGGWPRWRSGRTLGDQRVPSRRDKHKGGVRMSRLHWGHKPCLGTGWLKRGGGFYKILQDLPKLGTRPLSLLPKERQCYSTCRPERDIGACGRMERFGVGFKEEKVRKIWGEMVHVMVGHLPFSCQDEKAKFPNEA
jgi:hypothetical protein